jgi:hypothetical protein
MVAANSCTCCADSIMTGQEDAQSALLKPAQALAVLRAALPHSQPQSVESCGNAIAAFVCQCLPLQQHWKLRLEATQCACALFKALSPALEGVSPSVVAQAVAEQVLPGIAALAHDKLAQVIVPVCCTYVLCSHRYINTCQDGNVVLTCLSSAGLQCTSVPHRHDCMHWTAAVKTASCCLQVRSASLDSMEAGCNCLPSGSDAGAAVRGQAQSAMAAMAATDKDLTLPARAKQTLASVFGGTVSVSADGAEAMETDQAEKGQR